MKKFLVLFAILLVNAHGGRSQGQGKGIVQGSVMSREEKQPLPGATIRLRGTVYGTTSASDGRFILKNIPEGEYTLSISMIGYASARQTVVVRQTEPASVTMELEQTPVLTAPVVVTASKREQSLKDVPVSMSVVDERDIAHRNTVTVDDALRYVPGVNMTHSQVNVRGSTGYSYGVGTRILLLVDGEPMLSGDTGEIIWESIPTVDIERIEIVKGAGSALYGSNALGGVINIITREPGESPETRIRLYGGMYETPKYDEWKWTKDPRPFSGIMAAHQERIGDWMVSMGGSRTLDDGYKRNDFWKRWNLWSRVGVNLSAFQSVDVGVNVLDQRRGNFLYWKDINHVLEPKDGQLSQRVQSLRWSVNGNYRHIISSNLSGLARVTWFRSRWENNIPGAFTPAGDFSRSDFLTSEVQMNYQPSEQQFITGGITGTFNDVDADTIFGTHSSSGGALYLQDELQLSNSVHFTLGARYDYQKTGGVDPFSQFNPKLGLVYSPAATTSLRASVGRGFRAPSIAEAFTTTEAGGLVILPNTGLQPERSWSFEVGGTQAINGMFTTDLAVFRNEFWDLIEPSFAPDGYVHFQNITRARITGVELALRLQGLNGVFPVQLSYTYVNPEDVTKNDILKYRPRHLVYCSLQGIFRPVTLGVDFRFISRTERIDDELVLSGTVPEGDRRVPIYLVDVRAIAEWSVAGLPITSSFQVNNLLQYYYTDFIGNLGPTRSVVLTLESTIR